LMYGGKYSAVIGRETRFFVFAQYENAGYGSMRFSQGWGLRCHWESSPIGDSKRTLQIMI